MFIISYDTIIRANRVLHHEVVIEADNAIDALEKVFKFCPKHVRNRIINIEIK